MSRAFSAVDFAYDAVAAPVLLIGDSAGALARAQETAEACDLSVMAAWRSDEAIEGLPAARALAAIWLEIADHPSMTCSRLLRRIGAEAARTGAGLVVATELEHLDEVLLELGDVPAELLVNAEPADRLGALSFAASSRVLSRANDASTEANAARLRQLSQEVNRIATALARLSTTSAQPPLSHETMAPPLGDVPNVSAEALRTMIRARRMRAEYLPADLFADPAWDMLLDLLQAEIIQSRVPVSSLCSAAAVPATTALRWIKTMTDRGLLLRRDDPHDGRRVFIEMAPATSSALRQYFHDVGMAAV